MERRHLNEVKADLSKRPAFEDTSRATLEGSAVGGRHQRTTPVGMAELTSRHNCSGGQAPQAATCSTYQRRKDNDGKHDHSDLHAGHASPVRAMPTAVLPQVRPEAEGARNIQS